MNSQDVYAQLLLQCTTLQHLLTCFVFALILHGISFLKTSRANCYTCSPIYSHLLQNALILFFFELLHPIFLILSNARKPFPCLFAFSLDVVRD